MKTSTVQEYWDSKYIGIIYPQMKSFAEEYATIREAATAKEFIEWSLHNGYFLTTSEQDKEQIWSHRVTTDTRLTTSELFEAFKNREG